MIMPEALCCWRVVQSLKLLYSAILPEPLLRRATDGPSMFLALERVGRVDESNMKHVLHALRLIKRYDLLRCLTLRKRKPGKRSVLYSVHLFEH